MVDRTIVLDGFSKTYAMTGWRLATPSSPSGWSPLQPAAGQQRQLHERRDAVGGVEALTGPQDSVAAMVEEFRARAT